MYATIPVELHRLWCADLVGPVDASGWPMWAGVSITADVWLEAPPDWTEGMDVVEPDDDVVEIYARRSFRMVAQRFWPPTGADPGVQTIYQRLRNDRWDKERAAEAANMLAAIDNNQ